MTGYGRATRRTPRVSATVEVRTVNSRHLTVRIRAPGEWVRLEPRVEAEVRKRLQRGTVDAHLRIDLAGGARMPRIDERALDVYRQAAADLGDAGGCVDLLRLPGVVSLSDPELPDGVVEKAVNGAVREALTAVDDARVAEGERLTRVLRRERSALGKHVTAVARRAPGMARDAQAALRRRAGELLDGAAFPADDPALVRELALLAERHDVTEELDRLASHLDALDGMLDGDGAVGRELDFLLQEVGREVNTIGSKCADVKVTTRVVAMKGCVERLREQAANIE